VSSFQKRLDAVADAYSNFGKWLTVLGGVAVIIMCFYTTGDALGRYVFTNPLPASVELTLILLIVITFLGIAHVQARGGHMRLEFLSNRLAPRGQAILNILSVLIGLFLFALITWQGWRWTLEAIVGKEEMMGQWGIPYYPARLALTFGAFTLCIQYIINLVQYIVRLFSKTQVGEG